MVRQDVAPEQEGMVFINGELWRAYSPVPVPKGTHVQVVAVEGLRLEVQPVKAELEPPVTVEQPVDM